MAVTSERLARVAETSYRAWAVGWLGVAGVGIVNGGVHRLYIDHLGELSAHQVSGLTFAALYLPYVNWFERRRPIATGRDAAGLGLAWAAGAVTFDALVGHYLAGDTWADVVRSYDLSQGRIWSLVVLLIALGPTMVRAVHRRRPS
jgi:hypothetical protein